MGVGVLGLQPPFFFASEPREILLAIDGYEIQKRESFYLQQTALTNAIGLRFTKGYKVINPFEDEKTKQQKTVSKEEKENTLDFLKQKFE